MSDPKVLHLDHTLALGGAELALDRLCKRARNWIPTIALPHHDKREASGAFAGSRAEGTKVIEIGPPQTPGATSGELGKSVLSLVGVLHQAITVRFSQDFADADVIHANTSRSGLYGSLACWTSRKPLVVHLRDMVTSESLGRVGQMLFRKVVLSRADAVIGNSAATLDSARSSIRPDVLVEVIPSPTGISKKHVPALVQDRVSRIGMVARIDPWKGQDLLISAFAAIFAGSTVRLVLAGSPAFGHETYLQKLHTLTEDLGIMGQVDFLGQVSNVEDLLGTLDVCVQASLRPEPLGQNVLQYLSCGRPTVAANAGGPREWITHDENGLLFEAGDASALAHALRRLSNDKRLRQKISDSALVLTRIPGDQEISDLHGDVFRRVTKRTRHAIQNARPYPVQQDASAADRISNE